MHIAIDIHECPICLIDMAQRQFILMSCCRNTICRECYFNWRRVNSTCPFCRHETTGPDHNIVIVLCSIFAIVFIYIILTADGNRMPNMPR